MKKSKEWVTTKVVIPDYMKRMFKEKDKLSTKIDKLADFLIGAEDLDQEKRELLEKQGIAMLDYHDIVAERLYLEFEELAEGVLPKGRAFSIDHKGNVKDLTKKEIKEKKKEMKEEKLCQIKKDALAALNNFVQNDLPPEVARAYNEWRKEEGKK